MQTVNIAAAATMQQTVTDRHVNIRKRSASDVNLGNKAIKTNYCGLPEVNILRLFSTPADDADLRTPVLRFNGFSSDTSIRSADAVSPLF